MGSFVSLRKNAAPRLRAALCLTAFVLGLAPRELLAASEHYGQVVFAGVAVPGATVTALQGETRLVTATDPQGVFRFAELAEGTWTITVEMLGFSPLTREVAISGETPPSTWALTLLAFEEIARDLRPSPPAMPAIPAASSSGAATAQPSGRQTFQRAGINLSAPAPVRSNNAPPPPEEPVADGGMGAADGLLISGSVTNGAASPFAQPAAFGNNRRRVGALYNGGFNILAGNSALDARPFSFTSQQAPKPDYNDLQFAGTIQGPLRIPGLVRSGPNTFIGYQRSSEHNAITQPALVPSPLERAGDFSQSVDGFGRPVEIMDPATGLPFAGNRIPQDRISPQAASLLGYYPQPNLDADGRYNFQRPIVTRTRQDSLQSRIIPRPFGRNQVNGTVSFQHTTTDAASIFGFEDSTDSSALDANAMLSRRFSQFLTFRFRYQFTRTATETTPYFANRTNVSGNAGIRGNNQDPENWGPPALVFSSGIERLIDDPYARTSTRAHTVGTEGFLTGRGRHNFTFGGSVRRQSHDIQAQQDARGMFTFTGAATGSDLADFLLGLPQASSIAFGNADKYFRGFGYDAYITDDWRISPGLTLNLGLRWEYEGPFTEAYHRLVNLDVAPGFAAVSPVTADNPVGSLTGRRYPNSLLSADPFGIQPRLGLAWRPIAGSSLVIRAGYGIYRNTNVYQNIATQMAQQPPLSTTFSVESTPAAPLNLANGFIVVPGMTPNTFAIDPDFNVGSSHTWQASAQRDLPGSLTVLATYTGTRGAHLIQAFLPNTYPVGAVNPCPSCASGFIYLTSTGSSSRHAGSLQLRRRLRNGMTATVQYTLAKAEDDAAAFAGTTVSGSQVAQDWRDLDAEWGPSNFDQRHLVTAQFQYTTGVGVAGGALTGGLRGSLLRNWTITTQLTTGSGLPITPVYLTPVRGSGITGPIRADVTGASTDAPSGYYLNPAAYTPPAPGRWGTAGRNSVTGPTQFGLNSSISRTFPWGTRYSVEWRIDATNVLNRVTYAGVNTLVGSPQFGLPNRTNTMRKLQTSLRLRF